MKAFTFGPQASTEFWYCWPWKVGRQMPVGTRFSFVDSPGPWGGSMAVGWIPKALATALPSRTRLWSLPRRKATWRRMDIWILPQPLSEKRQWKSSATPESMKLLPSLGEMKLERRAAAQTPPKLNMKSINCNFMLMNWKTLINYNYWSITRKKNYFIMNNSKHCHKY